MAFISYAQNYEDVMLWRALKHVEKGFYVDVGANDPVTHSVTKAFHERGWQGINIEPMPLYYERLCDARPHDINLPIAVAETEGELVLYEIPETGLSTLDKKTAERHHESGWPVIERSVSVLTLNQIFEEHVTGPIHFLKIDVEGTEKQVLQGIDFSRWRPWVLVIEATIPFSPEPSSELWEDLVLSADYEMAYFDGLNQFYVASEVSSIANQLKTPPNFFDDFVRSTQIDLMDERDAIQAERDEIQKQIDEVRADRTRVYQQFTNVSVERDELQKQLDEVWADRERIHQQFTDVSIEREEIRKQLDEVWADRARVHQQFTDVSVEREEIRKQLDEVWASRHLFWAELDAIYHSRSWRLTAPLRTFSSRIRHWKDRINYIRSRPLSYILAKVVSRIVSFLRHTAWGNFLLDNSKKWFPRFIYRGAFWMNKSIQKEIEQTPPIFAQLSPPDEQTLEDQKYFVELFQRELSRRQKKNKGYK